MNELLQKALAGVDPDAPDAFWRILHNLLGLVPWWPLVWFTVGCAVAGALIGWWRGRIVLGIALGVVIGPLGWLALWAMPPGPHGPAHRRRRRGDRVPTTGAAAARRKR